MPASPDREDPIIGYMFHVEISCPGRELEMPVMYCTGVNGVSVDTEVVEFLEGGQTDKPHKFPGVTRVNNVRLERGIVKSDQHGDFLKWLTDMGQHQEGTAKDRATVSITVLTQTQDPVIKYTLVNAWPTRWQLGPLEGTGGGELTLKFMEFACERIEMGTT
jgi:phage tail-like protein